tara:strand:+ start:33 stop:443 length:411 start_codon:yes stop_codon:yes gene_type:complete
VLPRIRDNLRLRKNKISNDIERAELIKSNIEKIVKDYEFKIDKARDKANLIVKESAKKAQQDFFSQLESSKNKIEQKILNAEKEIVAYKDNFSSDINEISIEISSLLIEKVLGQKLNKDDISFINNHIKTSDGRKA